MKDQSKEAQRPSGTEAPEYCPAECHLWGRLTNRVPSQTHARDFACGLPLSLTPAYRLKVANLVRWARILIDSTFARHLTGLARSRPASLPRLLLRYLLYQPPPTCARAPTQIFKLNRTCTGNTAIGNWRLQIAASTQLSNQHSALSISGRPAPKLLLLLCALRDLCGEFLFSDLRSSVWICGEPFFLRLLRFLCVSKVLSLIFQFWQFRRLWQFWQ